MELKEALKPNKFKITFTVILTIAFLGGAYYFLKTVNPTKLTVGLLTFAAPIIILSYLISALIAYFHSKRKKPDDRSYSNISEVSPPITTVPKTKNRNKPFPLRARIS